MSSDYIMGESNFASYNIEDLFDSMRDKEAGMKDLQLNNILQNYQIYLINSQENESRAEALKKASN